MSRLLLALAAWFLSPSEARATIVVPMTIEEMAIEASCVARGRVLNTQATWDDAHRRIYTYTEIEILERIHAKGEVASNVVVRTLGGEVGNIGMKVSGTPKFTLGEEVVVFLRNDPVDPTQFQVIGMSQGKFQVERPQKGGAVAVPSVEGLAFAKPGAGGKMMVDPTHTDAARIPLDTMRQRVRSAVQPAAPTSPQAPAIDVTPPSAPDTTIEQ